MAESIKLTVKEAPKTDVGRSIARLPNDVLQRLGIQSGDVVEITGSKSAVAIVWRGLPDDEGTGIIRMDGILRSNAGSAIDDEVSIKKVSTKPAKKITIAPTKAIQYGSGFVEYVHERLLNKPYLKGNKILVDVMGTPLTFIVSSTNPGGVIHITPETSLNISNKVADEDIGVPHLSYEDIGGLKEEIETIREMIEVPMRYPQVFKRLGVSPPKGVLLYGPPGTGKTLLAKAVANETEAHFIHLAGPEIMSKYYGQSEENLREVFKEAQENSPSIVFIDEIDAIAPSREEVHGEVEKRVVSQLLTLMDGLEARGEIVVIAATNRPDSIDPALRRPGRFDREIQIGVPGRDGRKEIIQIHTRGMPLTDDVDIGKLADVTHGYTGADLSALTKEAAMRALKKIMPDIKKLKEETISKEILDKIKVTHDDFLDAMKSVEPSAMREVMIEIPKVSWNEIGGLKDAKQELQESVEWPMKYRNLFKELGVHAPRGIILYGPPGTGKTLLARAVANESEANFIPVKGPELLNKYVGESERAVRKIFRRARHVSPSIIFFDEIESLTSMRTGMDSSGARESVVAQLLTELDGIAGLKDVVVIGATNRPDLIDSAILRPGRFEKLIYVPLPDKDARTDIWKIHTKELKTDGKIDLKRLVELTENYSGADIEAVVRKAGIFAIRRNIKQTKGKIKPVTMKDFEEAIKIVKPSVSKEDLQRWETIRKRFGH